MKTKKTIYIIAISMVAIIGVTGIAIAGNLPQTPINQILENKSSLMLSDSQIKNLNRVNNGIINKMLQIKGKAQMFKGEIDKYSAKWDDMSNPKFKSTVKDYYNCLADLKNLEFEALVQAGKILSKEQVDKFSELLSVELAMKDMNTEKIGAF
ncbi:MAG: hypothetical protein GY839_18180 [candidate division Zixibacteria bacterium]|nr:hypothetical protein [candidate division Zixibacteria bacterium]